MDHRVFRHDGRLAGTEGQGMLTPVRRVAGTDRIADPARLLETVAVENSLPCRMNIACNDAGLQRTRHRHHPLFHRGGGALQFIRRLADMNGARQTDIVAAQAGPELESNRLAGFQRRVGPERVCRRCRLACQNQRM